MPRPAKITSLARAHHAKLAAVSAALLVLGLVGAHGSYHEVERERHTQEVSRWSEEARFTYEVPVTRNATLWPLNSTLPMGQPAYYRTVSEFIHLQFDWRAKGLADPDGMAQADLALLVRSESRQGRTYWEVEHPLAQAMTGDAAEGIVLRASLNLDNLNEEITRINRELPTSDGRVNWTVRATVAYALRSGEHTEAATARYDFPFVLSDPRVELPKPDEVAWERPHVRTTSSTLEKPAGWPGVLSDLRAQAFTLVGGAGVALALWAGRTDPTRGMTRRELDFRREHEKFEEWVTTASRPVDAQGLPHPIVDVEGLEDLVAVASDARSRVLLDPATRIYYAVLPTMTYRYAKHALRAPGAARNEAPLPAPRG